MSKDDLTPLRRALHRVPTPRLTDDPPGPRFDALLEAVSSALEELDQEGARAEALRLGAAHPDWHVRSLTLDAAARWLPQKAAEKTILDLTHDSVDVIAFQSIRLCGVHHLRSAVLHLVRISGWPSTFSQTGALRKPVGVGAAWTMWALGEILGSNDPEELSRLEREFLRPYRQVLEHVKPRPDLEGMILIPEGPFVVGTSSPEAIRFECRDATPEHTENLPAFYIDRVPVTNRDYCHFVRSIEQARHLTCSPDEPPDKNHWPAHLRDPRFGADDFPVTGIDWYDALAYANWCGKKLPSELQWEKAARGSDGRLYPWGKEWHESIANSAETSLGKQFQSLEEWERALRQVSAQFPEHPLWPVGSHPAGDSPYGVSDMAGNVWEWTGTNFYTREPMEPFFKHRPIADFTNRPAAFPVIRGGCWTSLPDMLRSFFRGKDLLTDRHFEIGFRCVVQP